MTKQGMEPYFSMALERTALDQETGFGRLTHSFTMCVFAWLTKKKEAI